MLQGDDGSGGGGGGGGGGDGDGDSSLPTSTAQVVSGEPQPARVCHLMPIFPLGGPRQPTSNAIVVKVVM